MIDVLKETAMKSKDENSEEKTPPKKYLQLNYYGGVTTLGGMPKDPNWLKEILRFFGIRKAHASDKSAEDDGSTPDY